MASCKTDFLLHPAGICSGALIGRFSKFYTVDPQWLKLFREIKKGLSYQEFEANKHKKKVRECKYHALSQWTLNMNWSDKKGKERNWHSCFEINSVFWTSVQWYTVFFLTCQVFKTCFELSRVKLCTIVPEKKGIYHLPSIPCACLGVIASGLRDENMNFT